MHSSVYIVIMAGGIGSRFWPISRVSCPKQFLDILGTGKTLLQQTVARWEKDTLKENIYIITAAEYTEIALSQLPDFSPKNIIGEPLRRNTATATAFMAMKLFKRDPKAKMVILPSDHLILDEVGFKKCCDIGLDMLDKVEGIVTLGIKPTFPNTGYGYLQKSKKSFGNDVFKIRAFTEKPDKKTAQHFINTGEYLWNSGIFISTAATILSCFRHFMPELYLLIHSLYNNINTAEEEESLKNIYPLCPNISFDVGVMEKTANAYVVAGNFGWSDLGTWKSVWENLDKDVLSNAAIQNNLMAVDSEGCMVHCEGKKLVLLQGLHNYIIVETDDVLMICEKENEQEIKQYVEQIRRDKGMDVV